MYMGVTTQSKSVENLFAGDFPRAEVPVTIALGEGNLLRGTLLGKITKGDVSSAAKSGGNTGDGTLVLDETTPLLNGSKAGIYKVRFVKIAIAQVGTTPPVPSQMAIAQLKDPDGNVLEIFQVYPGGGTAISNQLKFTMTEGSTPFAPNDGFDITVATGSGKYGAYDNEAVNGLEKAVAILASDANATSADEKSTAFISGEFNESAITGLDATAKKQLEGSLLVVKKIY